MGKFIKIILKSNLMQFKEKMGFLLSRFIKNILNVQKNVTSKKLWSLPSNSAFLPTIMHKDQFISECLKFSKIVTKKLSEFLPQILKSGQTKEIRAHNYAN